MKNYPLKAKAVSFAFLSFILLSLMAVKCEDDCERDPTLCEPDIVGQKGNPQFNLQFTNPEIVDLDLYVEAPNGEIVYYANVFTNSGGQLDIDCQCGVCPNGPNENIFWPLDGNAPRGTYKYWVEYFGSCDFSNSSSSFTLRVLKNGQIESTRTGTLSSGMSQIFTYTH